MKKTSNKKTFTKLIIVAHPDDELIFAGAELIHNTDYKVLCITNQNNKIRIKEFTGLMNKLKLSYEILDHPDKITTSKVDPLYSNYVKEFITKNKNKLTKIVTHNSRGEYGHPFHKAVHKMVKKICKELQLTDKLYFFGKTNKKINKELLNKKYELMEKHYPSQYKVLDRLKIRKDLECEKFKKA